MKWKDACPPPNKGYLLVEKKRRSSCKGTSVLAMPYKWHTRGPVGQGKIELRVGSGPGTAQMGLTSPPTVHVNEIEILTTSTFHYFRVQGACTGWCVPANGDIPIHTWLVRVATNCPPNNEGQSQPTECPSPNGGGTTFELSSLTLWSNLID